jgi:hypothetical protein
MTVVSVPAARHLAPPEQKAEMSSDIESFDDIIEVSSAPTPRESPEREALALLRAQQFAAVDVAKEHEQDLRDFSEGRMTKAEYREAEADRDQYIDATRVFFNHRVGDYCVEIVPWTDIPCGRCGRPGPGDPCEGCGRVQPCCSDDYERANQMAVLQPWDE